MPETSKTVMMLQLDADQGRLWELALTSQGIKVNWQPAEVDLIEVLTDIQNAGIMLPDLLLLDIGVKSPNSNNLQAVPVCQWARASSPPLQVLLLNVNSLQIKPYEYKWATGKCGAIGILPKLTQATLLNSVALVTSTLGVSLFPERLDAVSLLIAEIYSQNMQFQETAFREILENLSRTRISLPEPEVEDTQNLTTYRGVVIHAKLQEEHDASETMIQDVSEESKTPKVPNEHRPTSYRGVKIEPDTSETMIQDASEESKTPKVPNERRFTSYRGVKIEL